MPSNQIFFSVMFVGKCSCTSHVLQYSSSLSYEHSRSLQSFLCSGAVTVLICSFFVAALLNLHNFEKRRQNYILFYIPPNFSAFFLHIQKNWHRFLLFFHYSLYLCTRSIKSSARKGDSPTEFWKPRWSVRCGSNIYKLQNIPNYATAHLLHSLCSAFRRHADFRVSIRFQRPSAKPKSHKSMNY